MSFSECAGGGGVQPCPALRPRYQPDPEVGGGGGMGGSQG